jgi:hypothetical protein
MASNDTDGDQQLSVEQYIGPALADAVALGEMEGRVVVLGGTGSFGVHRCDLHNRVKVTLDSSGCVVAATAG